jgi:uncharacterized protein YbjQ (UPF0145 family)
VDKYLPYLQIAGTIASVAFMWVLWSGRIGFAGGRWAQDRESSDATNAAAIERLQSDAEELCERITEEHVQRREERERLNVELGKVVNELSRLQERMAGKIAEADREHAEMKAAIQRNSEALQSLQRQVDRMGAAGV